MKKILLLIFILSYSACLAQINFVVDKEKKKDTLRIVKPLNEKKEIPTIKQNLFLLNNNIIRNTNETPYITDFQKASLKEVITQGNKTGKELLEDNMQNILSDVRKSSEDKRSLFLKTVQQILSVAQAAVVTALAVREIVKDKEKTR